MISNGNPWNGFFYPTLTLIIDSYILLCKHILYLIIQFSKVKNFDDLNFHPCTCISVPFGSGCKVGDFVNKK